MNIVQFDDKQIAVEGPIVMFDEEEDDPTLHEVETLEQCLERPVRLGYFQWTENDVLGSIIATFDLPGSIVNKSDFLIDKLNNWTYLRCDVEVGIRLNGTAFHYGKLLVSWDPCYLLLSSSNQTSKYANLISASGAPFIILTPTQSETVQFTIPFVFPYYYLHLVSRNVSSVALRGYSSMGLLKVFVLNPLQQYSTAPSNPVGVTIYARMINVSVQGPGCQTRGAWYTTEELIVPNVYPPLNAAENVYESEHFVPQSMVNGMVDPTTQPTSSPFVRSGYMSRAVGQASSLAGRVRNSISSIKDRLMGMRDPEASAKSRQRTSSRRMEKAGTVLNKLAKVPVIGKFAKVAEVAVKMAKKIKDRVNSGKGLIGKIVKKVRRRRGKSRPNTEEADSCVIPRLFNLCHTHSLNPAPILGIWSDSKIDDHDFLIGSHEDELDIDYIASTPSIAGISLWQSTVIESEPITPWLPVSPGLMTRNVDSVSPTVLAWLARPFRLWRGSIRIHFQFTASSFHAGRLALVWQPAAAGLFDSLDDAEANAIMRIIDVKTETDCSVTFPYFNMKPWCLVGDLSNDSSNCRLAPTPAPSSNNVASEIFNSGYFRLFVVNRLTHSENPPPPVYINYWISGGEDFQLAFPTNEPLQKAPFGEFEPQCSVMREDIRDADYAPIFDMSTLPDVGITVPESVVHLKDVLMRFCRVLVSLTDSTVAIFNRNASWASLSWQTAPMPYHVWFEALFRFRRGSYDIKATWYDSTPDFAPVWLALDITPPLPSTQYTADQWIIKTVTDGAETAAMSQGAVLVKEPVSNSLEATLPYYSNALCEVVGVPANSSVRSTAVNTSAVIGLVGGQGSSSFSVYTSASDSYQLGFMIGAPTIIL